MIQVITATGTYNIDGDSHTVEEGVLNVSKGDAVVARFKWESVYGVLTPVEEK